jgi:hypothetical protein
MTVEEMKELIFERIKENPADILEEHGIGFRDAIDLSMLLSQKAKGQISVQRIVDISHGIVAGLVLADAEKEEK